MALGHKGISLSGRSIESFRVLHKRLTKRAQAGLTRARQPPTDEILALLEQLRICQMELETQNAELRVAQADVTASRTRYFNLYNLAPVGYVTLDEQGVTIEMNRRAADFLEKGGEPVYGRSFYRFIAEEDRDAYYLTCRRLVASGKPQACELELTGRNGAPFWVRLEMSAGEQAGARVYYLVIVNIGLDGSAEFPG